MKTVPDPEDQKSTDPDPHPSLKQIRYLPMLCIIQYSVPVLKSHVHPSLNINVLLNY